jgi:5-methylcytosine-specific restriction endonuclease McrA
MARVYSPKFLNCEQCNIAVKIPHYRQATFRFCSRKCGFRWHQSHPSRIINCAICNKEFSVIPCRIKTAKYCSKQCYYKANVGSILVKCAFCETRFLRSPSHLKTSPIQCCSKSCRNQVRRSARPGNADFARKWFKTHGLLTHCNRCTYSTNTDILVIHHKDRNRKNNELENLEILCPNCHALEHYGRH